jgi:hypothetical protein
MEDLRNKREPIRLLIARLEAVLGKHLFSLVEYWEADNCAIGLRYKNAILYLAMSEPGGRDDANSCYYLEIDIEYKELESRIIGEYENLTPNEVINEVREFIQLYENKTLNAADIPFLRVRKYDG